MSPINLVLICTGNTCRSPMAEAIARSLFTAAGLAAQVSSAGVCAMHNQPASRHAITAMEEGGLCLLSHQAQMVSDEMLNDATLVLTMTKGHKAMLLSDYPLAEDKIFTLAEYAEDSCADVSDPFGGSLEEYKTCAAQIRALLELALEKIKRDL